MDVLLDAIKKRAISQVDFRAAIQNRLFLNPVPSEKTPIESPYCAVQMTMERPFWTFNDNLVEWSVSFTLVSTEQTTREVLALYNLLKACYDEAPLQIDGYHLLRFWREESDLVRVDDAWELGVEYRCWAQESP